MPPLEFGWFLPTPGDTTSFTCPMEVAPSMTLFEHVTQAAEQAGLEYMLIPTAGQCWEAWITSAMMVAKSTTIKMLVAVRPGYINPVLLAKMISTYDQLSEGRLCINLIAGIDDEESAADGITYNKEERYELMDEIMTIMKALWTDEDPIDFNGKYHQLVGAKILPPILQKPYPKIYLGGGSRQAWEISAKHASVYLFWGDLPERIADQIGQIRELAGRHGRDEAIGFGMRLQIICRENEDDAWAAAHHLVAGTSDEHKQTVSNFGAISVANTRMKELAKVKDNMLGANLWSGISTVRGGAGVAVVGNPEQCAATLQQFIDVGCHSFCLSGYLHDAEAERFGRLVRPMLVKANLGRMTPLQQVA